MTQITLRSLLTTLLGSILLFTTATQTAAQSVLFPQKRQAGKAQLKRKGDTYTLRNNLFAATYSHHDGKLHFEGCRAMQLLPTQQLFRIRLANGWVYSSSDMTLDTIYIQNETATPASPHAASRFPGRTLCAQFHHQGLRIFWTATLRDGSHYLRTTMYLTTDEDLPMDCITPMIYAVDNRKAQSAPLVVGNTRGAILASDKLFAGLETPMGINTNRMDSTALASIDTAAIVPMEGDWIRHTTLKKGDTWQVSAVVGLIAPGQARRSVLAYSERERAAAWHPMTIYNSWYELNIDRNNAPGNLGIYDPNDSLNRRGDYTGHMTAAQCADVVAHWKNRFYDTYGKSPAAFVFDDGWDAYGTWTFNSNFPNGFHESDSIARLMGAGIGAWLGPVGGYGASGAHRRDYWKDRGGMQLSNPLYYRYFVDCAKRMINQYDFRFFKFDGISAQFSATGPDLTDTGLENCEAIINIEREVRCKRPDIFFNTTVGTWASPFWFHVSDAVWRQEGDFGKAGVGDDREQWITYRDHLVYQYFVQRSPLCPINTLMTHGLILTRFGDVSKTMDYDGIVREMRCAFGCGSSMVELYTDYALLDTIADHNGQRGTLWQQLAACMDWQERNAETLPDTHWVGGDPWDGFHANIYGWASWNGKRATLTLRNPDTKPQELKTTLRSIFDIPQYIHGRITLTSSFADQSFGRNVLNGLGMNTSIDIDQLLTIKMPPSSVYVMEGNLH